MCRSIKKKGREDEKKSTSYFEPVYIVVHNKEKNDTSGNIGASFSDLQVTYCRYIVLTAYLLYWIFHILILVSYHCLTA